MKNSIILVSALFLAGTAFAQQEDRQGGQPGGSGSGQQGSGLFDRFDSDKDQRISQQEAQINQTLVANFGTADANSDGYLTRQEFGATFGQ